jgi:hypothetical protein
VKTILTKVKGRPALLTLVLTATGCTESEPHWPVVGRGCRRRHRRELVGWQHDDDADYAGCVVALFPRASRVRTQILADAINNP